MANSAYLITFFLLLAVADDLLTAKVHNWLVLSIASVSTLVAFLYLDYSALSILYSLLAAFAFVAVTFIMGALGAGDGKLLLALSPLIALPILPSFIVYSLVWGAIFGVLKLVLAKQVRPLMWQIYLRMKGFRGIVPATRLYRVPYTVAFLFSWFTILRLQSGGLL